MSNKKHYVVCNPFGLYLQDLGLLKSVEFPHGGPGVFGAFETAYKFRSQRQAHKARTCLLGPGRNSFVEPL